MSRVGWYLAALLSAQPLIGQVPTNSVTVTASQAGTLQPDQAVLGLTVTSGTDKGLDEIVMALQGVGVTSANFQWLSFGSPVQLVRPPNAQPQLEWGFQLPVAISKVKDTTAALAALAQTISQNSSGLSLTFSVQGTQISSQQTPTCNLADVIANARTQAQQLTAAAGLTPGMIQSISTSTISPCSVTVRFANGTVLMPSQPNSISITASRALTLQLDQIALSLSVTSGVNSGLDDVTAALQQAGISGVALNSVYTNQAILVNGQQPQSQLQWSFMYTTPLSKLKDTISTVLAAQQTLAKASPPLGLGLNQAAPQVSTDVVDSASCPNPDLVKDARAQAQKVAAAAGVSSGTILSLSNGAGAAATLGLANRLGDFSFVNGAGYAGFLLGSISVYPPTQGVTCSMTVAFQLL